MPPANAAQIKAHLANQLRGERTRQVVRGAVAARRAQRQGIHVGLDLGDILNPAGALGQGAANYLTSPSSPSAADIANAGLAVVNPAGALGSYLGSQAANVIAPPSPSTPNYVPYSPDSPAYSETAVGSASITGTGVNLRSQPSENSASLGQLPSSAVVEVLNPNGGGPTAAAPLGWARIRFGGVSGYVSKSYVTSMSEIPATPATPAVVAPSYPQANLPTYPTGPTPAASTYAPAESGASTNSSLVKFKEYLPYLGAGCAVVLVGSLAWMVKMAHKPR
jgi:hypothetical protein